MGFRVIKNLHILVTLAPLKMLVSFTDLRVKVRVRG